MKEVFLLPTIGETLFQPQLKQAEKHAPLLEEGKSFREVLEQAKSAPEKPLVKHPNDRSTQVHQEETKPLPQREEFEPQVETPEPSTPVEETTPVQAAVDPLAFSETEAVIVIPVDPTLTLDLVSEETVQLNGELDANVLEEVAQTTQPLASDLSLLDSLSGEKQPVQESQSTPVEKNFAQLIQKTQDEPEPALQEIEHRDQADLQSKANLKPEPQSSSQEAHGKEVSPSGGEPKQSDKAVSGQAPRMVVESAPGGRPAIAQEAVKENGRAMVNEAQPTVSKESAKPEAVQTSGPPSSPPAAKPIEPARLAEAHRPEIVQQVARELEVFGKSGQTSLRIQLYPEQLGRIDVRLVSKADGVQIVIHAENASTASLLERDLNFLRDSLAQAGVNLSGLTVGQGQAQARSDLSQSEFRAPHQNGWKFGEAAEHGASNTKSFEPKWRDSSSTFEYRI
ncbi:MAG: Flagellar hook-length control protein FliK [Anaerolineae bacterium]|nr:MAG: Flagellar hook-length control protein FliK [Anaerolineae bacterium]